MTRVSFTQNLQRHIPVESCQAEGGDVRTVLNGVFQRHPRLKSYVLDDRDAVRKHMAVFLNGRVIKDRECLSDPVPPDSEIYVMQALSGG